MKSILVTGGTGSFGQAFVKRILEDDSVRRVVVYSRDELKQFEMARGITDSRIRFFIGDVRDLSRLRRALSGIDTVVHAAALKQIPIAEYNPDECIKTNIGGAQNVIDAAIDSRVSRVLALSTDKAVNPINLYGATKLAAEKLFTAANNLAGANGPRFSTVRYGNVIGSRGSVIPFFRSRASTGQLPITDPRMTRFWLTLEQGVEFVIKSVGRMQGGEVFIPKLPATLVTDIARAVAPDCRHEIVGIRPGEKIHETLMCREESRNAREFDDSFVIYPSMHDLPSLVVCGGRPVPDGFEYSSASAAHPRHVKAVLEAA